MRELDASQSIESESVNDCDDLPKLPQGDLVLGYIASLDGNGQPLVTFQLDKQYGPIPAIATVPVNSQHIGRQVGLMFTQQSESIPVVIGITHNPLLGILDNIAIANADEDVFDAPLVSSEKVDGDFDKVTGDRRIVIEGKDEIVLKCGDASITLSKNGKISIRGKYLLNRSTGVNRIMGGSVQVN